eukprot:g33056.t1
MLPRWFHARELYSTDGATTPLVHAYGMTNMLPEFSGAVAVAIMSLLIFTLLTMCVGWCTRASTTFTFFAYTYLNLTDAISTMTKYSVIASHVLLLLAISQCGAVWSVDHWLEKRRHRLSGATQPLPPPKFAVWPRRLLQFLICIVYFGAAMTKFQTPAYFTSDQLSTWMQTNVNHANPIGEYMSQFASLLVVSAYLTIVWEITFIFLSWRGVSRLIVITMGIGFHVMTTLTLGLIVFPMVCIAIYFAFLSEEDIRTIAWRLRRFGLSRRRVQKPAPLPAGVRPGTFSVPSAVVFGGVAVIVAACGIEVEYWMDPYGLRRPEGPYALKELDNELVEREYLRQSGPVKPIDMIADFQAGTIELGGELFNPKRNFRIGDKMIIQATVSPPHEDMYLNCCLHDAHDHVVDSNLQPALREMRRCKFQYTLSDSLEPGKYSLVLKRAGGRKITTDISRTEIVIRTLTRIDNNKNLQLHSENKLLQYKVKNTRLGQFTYDSTTDENEKGSMLGGALTPVFDTLHGSIITEVLSTRGEVIEVKGYEELLAAPLKDNPIGEQFLGRGTNKIRRFELGEFYPVLSKKRVKPGDTWEETFEFLLPDMGTAKGTRKYKFEAFETDTSMTSAPATLVERLNRLGLECDDVPTEDLSSATTALACFPMYMVANGHAWEKEKQWQIPLVDIPGFEAIREAFAIGRQERKLDITSEHRQLLGTMLGNAKPADRVIYEFALETLLQFFEVASPEVVEQIRVAVANTIVAVASASGEGLLGTGEKINRHELAAIQHISSVLNLNESAAAKEVLESID